VKAGSKPMGMLLALPLQALASPGGETALDDTLVSISPVQTLSWCLHHFAAAVHIPAVALPTGEHSSYAIVCQNKGLVKSDGYLFYRSRKNVL
jgi:hypothetical protein